MKTKIKEYLKKKFPNLYYFKSWKGLEIAVIFLLIMFSIIGILHALLT